jgi:hypothetical protein
MRDRLVFALLVAAFACSLFTAPAQAQRARTFVASYGNDSNPCTFGSPCRTFQQAVNVVAAGGEVTAIDSAGLGPISISQSITISSPPGVEAGIVAASGNPAINIETQGVAIESPTPNIVQLRGLQLDGTGGGTNGIQYLGAGTRIEIIDCSIHNFSNDGILISPDNGFTKPSNTVIISNTVVLDNGSNGIELNPAAGGIAVFDLRGVIDHVHTGGNGQSGILVNGTNATFMDIAISNAISDSNAGDGIGVVGNGNVTAEVRDSTLSNNAFNGITVTSATVDLYANAIRMNNHAGYVIGGSGVINTFKNNNILNAGNSGTLTQVNAQ